MIASIPTYNDLQALEEALRKDNVRRLLVVRGGASFASSGANAMWDKIVDPDWQVREFSAFSANPDVAELAGTFEAMREFSPDAVVAIGGGSAMDVAKVLACGFEDAQACLAHLKSPNDKPLTPVPIFAVPTTAGTGSEATHFSVLYDGAQKYSMADAAMRPKGFFLVPNLTRSMPTYQRASTGLDAFCQALESLWSNGGTKQSDTDAMQALQVIVPTLPRLFADQRSDLDALLTHMMCGAHLAGRAIDVSKTTAAHALSYRLGALSGCAHGHSVAITIAACCDVLMQRLSTAEAPVGGRTSLADKLEQVRQLLNDDDWTTPLPSLGDSVRAWLARIPVPISLQAVGLTDPAQLEELAQSVNLQRLRNFPVILNFSDLEAILHLSK